MDFYMPTKFYSKEGVLKEKKDIFSSWGSRCLVVSGKNSARLSGALDDLDAVLKECGISYEVFDDIIPNPLMETCVTAGRRAHEIGADFIIGIGGGSVLDSAKIIALVAGNPTLTEETIYAGKWENAPLPLALIGLTAGTGSEVTKVAVMTNKDGLKKSIHDDVLYAQVAMGDPRYMESLPYEVTVSTAIDAFAHAFESYFSNKANEISQAVSIQCITSLWDHLEALRDPNVSLTLKQRQELYDASILGGLAICVTGTVFAHNVGYYLTEEHHVPHGFACAVFAPDLLKHELKKEPEYTKAFLQRIQKSEEELLDLIEALLPELNISLSEKEIETILPRWENNGSVNNTKGGMDVSEIKEILVQKFVK